ncbi:hypothetical protein [Streptomyces sp. CB01881]|uniref:hypothetical protein n=1 Tax=Streptomyces sp. CB01881 TaxID=2078691 RepID=UPI001883EB22|nr:hypothetical protein [Streptomyces sp. CB01881]
MTTPPTRRRRRRRRPAVPALTVPVPALPAPAVPAPAVPAAPVRAGRPTAVAGTGGGGCCRTWASEHLTQGGQVVRTTWHEPACRTSGRPPW